MPRYNNDFYGPQQDMNNRYGGQSHNSRIGELKWSAAADQENTSSFDEILATVSFDEVLYSDETGEIVMGQSKALANQTRKRWMIFLSMLPIALIFSIILGAAIGHVISGKNMEDLLVFDTWLNLYELFIG